MKCSDQPLLDSAITYPHLAKYVADLLVDGRFSQPYAGMPFPVVACAPVVPILATTLAGISGFDLNDDGASTVTADDQGKPGALTSTLTATSNWCHASRAILAQSPAPSL